MRVKKGLKDLDATDLDLPAGKKLYINDSLCLYYKGMKPRNCGTRKKYFLRIRLQEKGPYSIIAYIDDLKELFPNEDFSMFWLDCIISCVCTFLLTYSNSQQE